MDEAQAFIDSVLSHEYSSQYYDPVKAHDYYLQNRELKGRGKPKATDLAKRGPAREIFKEVSANIDAAKKTETKALATTHQASVERLRNAATAKREELHNRIKALLDAARVNQKNQIAVVAQSKEARLKDIADRRTAALTKIQNDLQTKLDANPPLPKGASKEARDARSSEIAKIKGEAKTETGKIVTSSKIFEQAVKQESSDQKSKISNDSANARAVQTESNKGNLKSIGKDLKDKVNGAKATYEAAKQQLQDKYDAIYQQEFNSIDENA